MRQIDREEDAMSTYDDDVSPYLRRRLRSYEEVVRETDRAAGAKREPGGQRDHKQYHDRPTVVLTPCARWTARAANHGR